MNIKNKLAAIISVLVTVALGLTILLQSYSERQNFRNGQANRRLVVVRQLERMAGDALEHANISALSRYIELLIQNEPIRHIVMLDAVGRIIFASRTFADRPYGIIPILNRPLTRRALAAEVISPFPYEVPGEPDLMEYAVPVRAYGGVRVATLRVFYDIPEEEKSLDVVSSASARRFLIIAVFVGALSALASIVLSNIFTFPIQRLIQGAKQVEEGNLDVVIKNNSSDELGSLTRQFNRMVARLKELDVLKEDFIAMVSHDLRSPLATIIMYTQNLKSKERETMSGIQGKTLDVITLSARRLTTFINNILDTAKIKAGKMEYRFQPQDIGGLVRDITAFFAIAFQEKELLFGQEIQDGLAQFRVDGEKIQQAVTNLISNAIKFTPRGGRVRVRVLAGENGSVQISVNNSGPVIPPGELGKLFKKFVQLCPAGGATEKQRGTGLGLVIAKEIVEAHGGKVWVESTPDVGTTFSFTIPQTNAGA